MKTETTRKLVNLLFIFCLCLPPIIGMTVCSVRVRNPFIVIADARIVVADAFDGLPILSLRCFVKSRGNLLSIIIMRFPRQGALPLSSE